MGLRSAAWKALGWALGLDRFFFERVVVRQSVVDGVCELAKTAHPKEFVVFLDGRVVKGTLWVERLLYQTYTASRNATHFSLDLPPAYPIIGTIHSHPGFSNRPSRADLALFQKHGMVHGIIKRPYEEEDLCFYDKKGSLLSWTVKR